MGRESSIRKTAAYKWALLLVGFLVVAGPSAAWLSGWTATADAENASVPEAPDLQALSASTPSAGVTEANMDAAFLLKLEADLVAKQVAHSRQALLAHGYPDEIARPEASSTYLNSGGRRFGIVRTRLTAEGATLHTLLVVALVGKEIKRVVCISKRNEVAFDTGPCADRIFDTFGATL